jgi:hypothetical protein
MPNINTAANASPPPPSVFKSCVFDCATAIMAVVVCTVNTVVPLLPEPIVMLAGFKPQVGRLFAPLGEFVRLQLRFSVPEYVLAAASVPVAVMLVPGGTVARLPTVIATSETVTVVVPANVS